MIGLLVSATFLLLDQWSKRAARQLVLEAGFSFAPFLRIRYVTNLNQIYRRAPARTALVLAWLASLASAITLHHFGAWFHSPIAVIGLGLAFGGAAGNLLDILRHNYVVDFVDLGWWPVFNLADVGIVGGLLLAFWR